MSRVPLLDGAGDAYAAIGTQGVIVRLGLLLACAASVGGAVAAGGHASPLLAICAALLALGTIARPDSHFGLALMVVLALHWYAADVPQLSWSLLPATAMLAVHVLAAHSAVVPPGAEVRRAVVSRWAGQTGAVMLGTMAVWLLTVSFGQVHAGGLVLLTTAGVLLMLLLAVALGRSSAAPDDL